MPDDDDTTPSGVHLVVLLHGLYGSSANLWCLEEEIARAHNDADTDLELAVLNAQNYPGANTWDGIDVNAHRVADEVDSTVARLEEEGKRVVAFSITGYSLGGLIARALVGELHSREPSFFSRHRPASFCTIATPHLGVLRYGSWRSTWLHAIGQRLFSRSGQQLYCLDRDCGRPFLLRLADPERIYYRALSQFPHITIIANGVNDLTVPYPTAAISGRDPFIDYEKGTVHVELNGKTVQRYYGKDEEAEEVERMVAPEDREPTPLPFMPSRRDWFPPIFYLPYRAPFRYALFPLLPFIVPALLTVVALTFAFHSFKSAERIRQHSLQRQLLLDADDTDTTATPMETPPASRPDTPGGGSDEESALLGWDSGGASTPPFAPSGVTQPRMTPAQRDMIRALNGLPQMERVVAWFPDAFNAHAVIIARNARNPKWAWQEEGRQVMRLWAKKVVAAITNIGEPLPVLEGEVP